MSGKRSKNFKPETTAKMSDPVQKISFDVWFYRQIKAGTVQFWQKREVSVFFKAKGLSDSEEADKYSELLKLY